MKHLVVADWWYREFSQFCAPLHVFLDSLFTDFTAILLVCATEVLWNKVSNSVYKVYQRAPVACTFCQGSTVLCNIDEIQQKTAVVVPLDLLYFQTDGRKMCVLLIGSVTDWAVVLGLKIPKDAFLKYFYCKFVYRLPLSMPRGHEPQRNLWVKQGKVSCRLSSRVH